jgi:hypothetical protein
LSSHLFWDVDRKKVDAIESKAFLIQRVLEYGFMTDWKATLKFYGADEIVDCAKKARYLETVAMHFVSNVFDVKLEDFRCYSFKQSTQNFWPG